MMSDRTINLRDRAAATDLGASWRAVEAWFRSGPLVLVQAERTGDQPIRARLDLDKQVFIDPTPFDSSGPLVDSLGRLLARLLGKWR
jgi:hypothetical protein